VSSSVFVLEFSGMATTGVLDTSQDNGTSATTSATSAAITTANANDLLVYGIGFNSSISGLTADVANGWAIPTNGSTVSAGIQYLIVSSIQTGITTTMTWTTTRDSAAYIAAFEAGAAGDDIITIQNQFRIAIG